MSEQLPAGWVKTVRELGSTGAVITIAAYLVYRLASGIPSAQDVTDVKALLIEHVKAATVEAAQNRSLLFAICTNAATTEQQRTACQAAR